MQVLKLEWWRESRELRDAMDTDERGMLSEADIEDAAQLDGQISKDALDPDDMVADAIAQAEEAEMDTLLSSVPEEPWSSGKRLDSPHFSDDDEYDALFTDFILQESDQQAISSQDVAML
jgi:hypothetical protein